MTEAMTVDTPAVAKKDPARPADDVDAELVGRPVEHARAASLEGEITDHLGYDKGDPAGKNGG